MTDKSAMVKYPVEAIALKLRSIWIVQADKKYDVILNPDIDDYILIRTISGQGRLTFEDTTEISVGSETIIIIPFRELKRYYCAEENWEFCWFTFSAGPNHQLPIKQVLYTPILEDEKNKIYMCLHMLTEGNIYKQNYSTYLFGELMFKWLLDSDQSNAIDVKNGDAIDKCASYIKNNFNKSISIKSLANSCGLCENQFRLIFIKRHGLSPKQFHMRLKMSCAKNLLANSQLSISEISDFLSFSNQFYFSKAFVKNVGEPPSEYRKGCKKQ